MHTSEKKVIIPEITQVYLYEIKNSLRHDTVSSYKGHAILRLFGIDQSDAEFIMEAGNHPFGTTTFGIPPETIN